MKYYAEPNLNIIDYDRMKLVFTFDEKGEYETDDDSLVKWMKKHKGFIRCQDGDVSVGDKEPEAKVREFVCKKCGEVFTNKGKFMSHARLNHK